MATLLPHLSETPSCAGCGETEATLMFRRDGDLHTAQAFVATTDVFQGFGSVVRCVACGLIRLSPRQRWAFLRRAYAESKDHLYLEESSGRLATARRLLRFVERYGTPGGRLLDVGCGPGILLDAASPRWEVAGVELSAWAVREARRRHPGAVFEGDLAAAAFPEASFDAVTMLDVIEHLPDPRSALREVHRVLKPGGSLLVYTPDIGAPVARLMGRWWWGLRPAHLYYFSHDTLAALLVKEGFEVRAARHFGRRFTLGYWISRLRGYAPPLVAGATRLSRLLRVDRLSIPINTFDSLAMLAVKR